MFIVSFVKTGHVVKNLIDEEIIDGTAHTRARTHTHTRHCDVISLRFPVCREESWLGSKNVGSENFSFK